MQPLQVWTYKNNYETTENVELIWTNIFGFLQFAKKNVLNCKFWKNCLELWQLEATHYPHNYTLRIFLDKSVKLYLSYKRGKKNLFFGVNCDYRPLRVLIGKKCMNFKSCAMSTFRTQIQFEFQKLEPFEVSHFFGHNYHKNTFFAMVWDE